LNLTARDAAGTQWQALVMRKMVGAKPRKWCQRREQSRAEANLVQQGCKPKLRHTEAKQKDASPAAALNWPQRPSIFQT